MILKGENAHFASLEKSLMRPLCVVCATRQYDLLYVCYMNVYVILHEFHFLLNLILCRL